MRVDAPAATGRFLLRLAAVQELVRWYDEGGPASEVWVQIVDASLAAPPVTAV